MNPFEIRNEIRISAAGLRRLRQGHLWVYSGDIVQDLDGSGSPLVRVLDTARNTVGYAFYSPASQIKLRLLKVVGQDERGHIRGSVLHCAMIHAPARL